MQFLGDPVDLGRSSNGRRGQQVVDTSGDIHVNDYGQPTGDSNAQTDAHSKADGNIEPMIGSSQWVGRKAPFQHGPAVSEESKFDLDEVPDLIEKISVLERRRFPDAVGPEAGDELKQVDEVVDGHHVDDGELGKVVVVVAAVDVLFSQHPAQVVHEHERAVVDNEEQVGLADERVVDWRHCAQADVVDVQGAPAAVAYVVNKQGGVVLVSGLAEHGDPQSACGAHVQARHHEGVAERGVVVGVVAHHAADDDKQLGVPVVVRHQQDGARRGPRAFPFGVKLRVREGVEHQQMQPE